VTLVSEVVFGTVDFDLVSKIKGSFTKYTTNAEVKPKISFNDESRSLSLITYFTYPASFSPRSIFVTSLTLLQQPAQRKNPRMKLNGVVSLMQRAKMF